MRCCPKETDKKWRNISKTLEVTFSTRLAILGFEGRSIIIHVSTCQYKVAGASFCGRTDHNTCGYISDPFQLTTTLAHPQPRTSTLHVNKKAMDKISGQIVLVSAQPSTFSSFLSSMPSESHFSVDYIRNVARQ
jgi:hypothetical protein